MDVLLSRKREGEKKERERGGEREKERGRRNGFQLIPFGTVVFFFF